MNLEYFVIEDLETVDLIAIKKMYRELMMTNHPDHGGSVEIAKAINTEMAWLADNYMRFSFDAYQAQRKAEGKSEWDQDLTPFTDILMKVMDFDMDLQVIGFWIYTFKSYKYRDQLKNMGFWYSSKHKAWVYNGQVKAGFMKTRLTLDQIKETHGYQKIEREEKEEELLSVTA